MDNSHVESALVLLKDIHSIQSYSSLLKQAADSLAQDGSLDIIIVFKIEHLNILDQILAGVYTLATDILAEVGKPRIDVNVLFNEHYKDLVPPPWKLIIQDEDDQAIGVLDCETRNSIKVENVKRRIVESNFIKLSDDESEENAHRVCAVGGTYDHFHIGHKILLTAAAFLASDKLIVGITDQELLAKKKYQELLQSYDHRKHSVLKFLSHIKPTLVVDPIAIRDVAGPTGYIEDIDSLVVSRETVSGGDTINNIRKEKGWHPLKIHIVNVIGGEEDDGFLNKLSSTQLRKEELEAATRNQGSS